MKVFKSPLMSEGSKLVIESSKVLASDSFFITHETVLAEKVFNFHNADAPALALAILEAAGVEAYNPKTETIRHGSKTHLKLIAGQLELYVDAQAKEAAEAEEQAKLEAEALVLFNASRISRGLDELDWGRVTKSEQREWLAVARKARELAKETGE